MPAPPAGALTTDLLSPDHPLVGVLSRLYAMRHIMWTPHRKELELLVLIEQPFPKSCHFLTATIVPWADRPEAFVMDRNKRRALEPGRRQPTDHTPQASAHGSSQPCVDGWKPRSCRPQAFQNPCTRLLPGHDDVVDLYQRSISVAAHVVTKCSLPVTERYLKDIAYANSLLPHATSLPSEVTNSAEQLLPPAHSFPVSRVALSNAVDHIVQVSQPVVLYQSLLSRKRV